MKHRSKAKETATKKETEKPVMEMADRVTKNYEQTLRTGLKLQKEAMRSWSTMVTQATAAPGWPRPFAQLTAITSEMLPAAEKRVEEVVELMGKNNRRSAELMRKAVDAAQTPAIAESQAKWMDFWTSAMRAMESNAEGITQITSRAIDSCIDFVRKNTETVEVRVPKTA